MQCALCCLHALLSSLGHQQDRHVFTCPVDARVQCRYKGCYEETTFDGVACSSLEQRCFSCYCSIAVQTFAGFSYCKRYWLKYIIQVTPSLSAIDTYHLPLAWTCLHIQAQQHEQNMDKQNKDKQNKDKQAKQAGANSKARATLY